MIATSERPDIKVIEANANVPLLAATGNAARGAGKWSTTFLSISASIAQVNNIARELGKLDCGQRQNLHPERPRLWQAPAPDACRRPGQADQRLGPARRHRARGL